MTPEYEEQAKAAERELADMEERAGKLGDQIDETRDDWESKKQDSGVPGAGGDPDRAEEGGRHPETAYPAKGSEDELSEADPTDNDRGVDDTPDDDDGAGGEERAGAEESEEREEDDDAGGEERASAEESEEDDGGGAKDERRGDGAEAG